MTQNFQVALVLYQVNHSDIKNAGGLPDDNPVWMPHKPNVSTKSLP